jgi:hypothetical protein
MMSDSDDLMLSTSEEEEEEESPTLPVKKSKATGRLTRRKRTTRRVEPAASEPPAKKIRSSPTDLKIVVGSAEDGKQEVFYHHSVILATHSDYVDAMLASPMAESETRELCFIDIEPGVWTQMLAFLEDPVMARRMDFEDAMLVLPFYDKYQFRKGKELCSELLLEDFKSICDTDSSAGLDTLVHLLLLADQTNLATLRQQCIKQLCHKLVNASSNLDVMFHEDHIRKLMPFIARDETLLFAVKATKEEALSPLFPKFLLTSISLQAHMTKIRVSGANGEVDGIFDKKTDTTPSCLSFDRYFHGRRLHFCIGIGETGDYDEG